MITGPCILLCILYPLLVPGSYLNYLLENIFKCANKLSCSRLPQNYLTIVDLTLLNWKITVGVITKGLRNIRKPFCLSFEYFYYESDLID